MWVHLHEYIALFPSHVSMTSNTQQNVKHRTVISTDNNPSQTLRGAPAEAEGGLTVRVSRGRPSALPLLLIRKDIAGSTPVVNGTDVAETPRRTPGSHKWAMLHISGAVMFLVFLLSNGHVPAYQCLALLTKPSPLVPIWGSSNRSGI